MFALVPPKNTAMSAPSAPDAHSRKPPRILLRVVALWPAGLCLATALVAGMLLQNAYRTRDIAEQQQQLAQKVQSLRDRLQAEATRSFSPTSGLTTLIQVDGSISQERFQQLIDRNLTLVPFIRSVVAAPDDVARYVHPLAGNERVRDLDYRTIPVQWQQIQLAREARAPRIFAPVKLVQGGVAVIQRTPVFLRSQQGDRYWGVVSVVVDLDRFMAASGVKQEAGLELAVFSFDDAGRQGELVWGQWNNTTADAGVSAPVDLPGARWTLHARPAQGWTVRGVAPEALAIWLSGAIVAVLIALLVRQSQNLHRGNRALLKEMANVRRMQVAVEQSKADSVVARDRLQAVLDAATEVAIIATDLEGRVTVFNRGAEELLGYTEDDVLGKSPAIWHDVSEIDRVGMGLRQADEPAPTGFAVFARLAQTDGMRPQSWTFITRQGLQLEVSLALSTVRAPDGAPLGYLGVARDLSAQRRAESDLRQLTDDLEHRVAERTTELQTALHTLRQTQDGLARAEKLAALGSLVAGVAHELNTPIGNCLTTASTLQERTLAITNAAQRGDMRKSAFEAYLGDARQASDILMRGLTVTAELVQHFKQLAVDQTSEIRRTFALASVVEDVVSLSRATWKSTPFEVVVRIDVEPDLDSYPGALGRVLGNLLQNALVHGFAGQSQGCLTISAHMSTALMVEMVVEDNGVGMSDAVRRRAFDPFFTTKLGQGGSGLGLNIAYNTVTAMLGGSIDLHSTAGQGTRFVLHFPLVAPQARTPA